MHDTGFVELCMFVFMTLHVYSYIHRCMYTLHCMYDTSSVCAVSVVAVSFFAASAPENFEVPSG